MRGGLVSLPLAIHGAAILLAIPAAAETPEDALSQFPTAVREWVNQSCPRSLGPSLWTSCVRDATTALRGTRAAPQRPARPSRRRTPQARTTSSGYPIELARDDELFIINGEKFGAQTYCLGWEEGDEVLFLEGSPFGACASAELFNLRTREKCDVWCE